MACKINTYEMLKKGLQEKLSEYFALVAFFSSFLEFFLDEVHYFVVLSFLSLYGAYKNDGTRPRGRQLHTVSCQNKVQTYQFDENISN